MMRSIVGMSAVSILKRRVTTMMLARQISAMVMDSPWQKVPVSASPASRRSTACNPDGKPVNLPGAPGGVVKFALCCQIFLDSRSDQRMGVGGEHRGQRAHAGAAMRIARQERGGRTGLVDKFKDRERLRDGRGRLAGSTIDQRRDRAERVDFQERLAALFSSVEVDIVFVRMESLEIESHAGAIGRRGTPEGEEFETCGFGHEAS